MKSTTTLRRGAFGAALAAGLVVAVAAPAFAHVEAEGSTKDGVTTVEFSFTHGCGESPTKELRIQLPAGTTAVEPEDPTGWTSKVTDTELTWTGGPAANGTKTSFEAAMKLTGSEGETVFFPTIQSCTEGTEDWIEKDADPEGEHAAPRIVLGATGGGGDHDEETTTTAADHDVEGTTSTAAKATTTTAASTTSAAPGTTAKAATTGTTAKVTAEPASSSNTGLIIAAVIAALVILALIGYLVTRGKGAPKPGSSPSGD
jgi:uncharacterized protein YcnI